MRAIITRQMISATISASIYLALFGFEGLLHVGIDVLAIVRDLMNDIDTNSTIGDQRHPLSGREFVAIVILLRDIAVVKEVFETVDSIFSVIEGSPHGLLTEATKFCQSVRIDIVQSLKGLQSIFRILCLLLRGLIDLWWALNSGDVGADWERLGLLDSGRRLI